MVADTILSIESIHKSFGSVKALDGISFDIKKGEFVTVLGPSGCGKTTLLRIIAGLEKPDEGSVWLDGQDLSGLAPEHRDVNTVFQNYALFPHMTVQDNVAYGLKMKKMPKAEIIKRVEKALELVELSGYGNRKPNQLSGGQRQRVAMARAIILRPKVLLLDEPLGALDYKLRLSMQHELKKMQKKIGTTFIYITHDQEEALNMSDRIVVMSKGRVEQIDTPNQIYKYPKTLFVANFVGQPNMIEGVVQGGQINSDGVLFPANTQGVKQGCKVFGVLRPECIRIGEGEMEGIIKDQRLAGGIVKTDILLPNGKTITSNSYQQRLDYEEDHKVNFSYEVEDIHLIEGGGE